MTIREWARRRSGVVPASQLVATSRLRRLEDANLDPALPASFRQGIDSFYDYLHGQDGERVCVGSACHFERGRIDESGPGAHCLGRCYEAPVGSGGVAGAIPRTSLIRPAVVLRHLVDPSGADPTSEYARLPPGERILEAVTASGLRGRGGAAFPTGHKWRLARDTPAPDRYVVANGDEGDPGAYVDRLLLEEDPHAVLAGMLCCARAIRAGRGVVFIRREYPRAHASMLAAIEQAEAAGWLEGFTVSVVIGAGSYVAGEETALLRAIEGNRAEPSPKPPYPAERGLEGLPTVIQNVETLAVVPWVVREGRRANTKVVCLSGAVARPGAVEIELGTPLRQVLETAGGGARPGRSFKMALVGGPMGRVLPESLFDTPLSFDALPGLGHGGIVLLDQHVSALDLARHLYTFASGESCGACAPCRIGTSQLASRPDASSLLRLLDTLEIGSLCGFGQGVPRPLRDLLQHFPGEMFPC